jgi:hypothetical protein
MHEPDRPMDPTCAAARGPASSLPDRMDRKPSTACGDSTTGLLTDEPSRSQEDVERLRFALRMVLDVDVFDSAGRAVTVERMLRGYVATAVRVALEGKRSG